MEEFLKTLSTDLFKNVSETSTKVFWEITREVSQIIAEKKIQEILSEEFLKQLSYNFAGKIHKQTALKGSS